MSKLSDSRTNESDSLSPAVWASKALAQESFVPAGIGLALHRSYDCEIATSKWSGHLLQLTFTSDK